MFVLLPANIQGCNILPGPTGHQTVKTEFIIPMNYVHQKQKTKSVEAARMSLCAK